MNSLCNNIPYSILRLGLACNANCLFCNVPPELLDTGELSTSEAKKKIAHFISTDRNMRLDITGGEPTIRKDLPELIRYARKNGAAIIQIQTNGVLLSDKNYVGDLKRAGLNKVFVGLHSSTARIHDHLVGLDGAFIKCIEGVKNCLKFDIEVILNPVITTKNYRHLPHYIKFIKNNFSKIRFISLSIVQPRGRAWINKYLVPRYKIISPYVKKALILGARYGLVINNPYCGLPLCIGGWYRYLPQCVEFSENLLNLRQGDAKRRINSEKMKITACFSCVLNNYCNGVWKEYALIHPLTDLKPLIKRNGKLRLYSSYAGL